MRVFPDPICDWRSGWIEAIVNTCQSTRTAPQREDMGSAPRPIQAGELVPLLSPSRCPPGYNRVFQSEGEIQRQVRALRNWAKSDGLFLSPADEQSIRGRAEASGGGEEHNVLLFRQEGESFVIKETRRESGFPGMAPAQYFARWEDLGKLWPALAVVLVGVSDHAIWVKQDFIDGEVYQDRSELDQDVADRGWVKPGPPQFTHKGTDAVIGDVKLAMSSKGWMGNRGLSMSSWNPREAFEQREAGSRTFAECRLDAPCPCPFAPPQSTKRSLDCGFTSVFSTRPFSWTASRVDQLTSRPLAGPEYSSGCDDPQDAVSWTRTAIWRGKRTFIG